MLKDRINQKYYSDDPTAFNYITKKMVPIAIQYR